MDDKCESCGASRVKLWRDSIPSKGSFHLQCISCIRKERGEDVNEFDLRIQPVPDSFQLTKVPAIKSGEFYRPTDQTNPALIEQWKSLPGNE